MTEPDGEWLAIVRRLIGEVTASDVTEFELAQAGFRLRLRRRPGQPAAAAAPQSGSPTGLQVPAPFTGVFYRAASPTAEPYVREGDWVEAGATIGLIETMKIFNEVQTDQAGRIERILLETGQLVHAGDPVLILTPADRPADGQ